MAYNDSLLECEWKKHPSHNDIAVSDNGRVMSYRRGKWKELKPNNNGSGYLRVGIGHENPCYIHRLVAETYIPNDSPTTRTQINHKDGNKQNNSINNLEWCTPSENDRHAFDTGLKKVKGRPIRVVETGDIYESEAECARSINGIQGNIALCLIGRRHTHRGYHFEYVEEGFDG